MISKPIYIDVCALSRPFDNQDYLRIRLETEALNLGFGVADAAHVAFAEQSGALFISCDNKLVKKCQNNRINVWCGNPVAFCEMEELR